MSLPAQTPHSKTQIEQAEPAVGRLESLQTASAIDPIRPLRVHGLDLSYFTGKLEATLRAKGLPYELVAMDTRRFRTMGKRMGIAQMPHLELPDGQILTDTSCILKWLEAHHPEPALMPVDPALCWIADLLEDFADEWLWRPALYYRWAFAADARLLSERLARGMLRDINAPVALRRWFILQRQRHVYLRKDGVSPHNAKAIEAIYHDTLDALCVALAQRPFLLGNRPTQADCGFFGPFFRHFSSDPTPSEILRERAKGKSYRTIARDIGMATASGVRKALYRALEDLKTTREELVVEYAGVQLERMRIALEAIMPRVELGEIEAIDMMLKIEARTSKLLALDAPGVWPEDGSGYSTAPGSIHSPNVMFDSLNETQLQALAQIGVVRQSYDDNEPVENT